MHTPDSADRSGNRTKALARAGLAAAVSVARQQGLAADDPRVLSSRGNLIVHLAPAPVVARVATLTAWTRSNPFCWLAREVAVAGYAALQGGPVIPPTDLADPGPHRHDGLALSLWTYRPASPDRAAAAEAGTELARLHIALAGYAGDLPVMSPARDQITEGLAALERERVLDPATVARLRARHRAVLAWLDSLESPAAVLHGDAHAGNLMRSGGRWHWFDLEETCRGPRQWDLAVLAGGQAADATVALAAYAAVSGTRVPAAAELAPFHAARELEGAVWSLGMAHQYPSRYREVATQLLDSVLHADAGAP